MMAGAVHTYSEVEEKKDRPVLELKGCDTLGWIHTRWPAASDWIHCHPDTTRLKRKAECPREEGLGRYKDWRRFEALCWVLIHIIPTYRTVFFRILTQEPLLGLFSCYPYYLGLLEEYSSNVLAQLLFAHSLIEFGTVLCCLVSR